MNKKSLGMSSTGKFS
jgi:hypothetical protein